MKILISIVSLITLITGGFTTFGFYAHKEFAKYQEELEKKVVSFEKYFFSSENTFLNYFFYFPFLQDFTNTIKTKPFIEKIFENFDKKEKKILDEITDFVDKEKEDFKSYTKDPDSETTIKKFMFYLEHYKITEKFQTNGFSSFFKVDVSSKLFFDEKFVGNFFVFGGEKIKYFDYFIGLKEKIPLILFLSKKEQFINLINNVKIKLKNFNETITKKDFSLVKYKNFFESIVEKYGIKIKFDSDVQEFNVNSISLPSVFIENVKIFDFIEFNFAAKEIPDIDERMNFFVKKYDLNKKLKEVFKVEFEKESGKEILDIIKFFNRIYYFVSILDYTNPNKYKKKGAGGVMGTLNPKGK